MDYFDEYDDGRPRFVFQSRPSSSSTLDSSPDFAINKPLIFISLAFSLLFLASSFFFFLHSQFLQSLSIWLSLSLLLGPFAPPFLTAGDIRVGLGDVVEFPPENDAIEPDDPKKKPSSKRGRARRSDLDLVTPELVKRSENRGSLDSGSKGKNDGSDSKGLIEEEKEWTEEDLVLLRKQMAKHPVGKPKRWEVISEAFNGRHSVESVINKAKSAGNEKPVDSDSYSKFLKDRKPVDKRVEVGDGEVGSSSSKEISWSSAEDMALLNALKTFTKDVAMRWEKIAAAVPGKSKAACMKRVSELKKEFRSSKAASEN